MGRTVRSVFLKSRSRHDSHGSGNGVEKKKWSSSVRSYLCGDELNSVLAAEDSASFRSSTEADLASFRSNAATNTSTNGGDISSVYAEEDTVSVRSSEATVNQPLHTESKEQIRKDKLNSTYKLFQQEDAALIIQSAFRSFLARRAREEAKKQDEQQECAASPSRESVGTSVEVQTGNSSEIFSIKEESFYTPQKMRNRTRAQVLKIQEDWDDSTVSSMMSKMRIQNKLEAALRRERALAYAFSQQLRICSKKKQTTINSDDTNTGWSWLERWMAARQPDINFLEESIIGSQKTLVRKRTMLDAAMEEKESCGSNEVSSLIEAGNPPVPKNIPKPPKNRSKARNSFSRQDSASSHLCPRESKDVKKVWHVEDEKEKRKRQKQPGNKRDGKNGEVPLQPETGQ